MSAQIEREIRKIGFCPHCGNQTTQKLVFNQLFEGLFYSLNTGERVEDPPENSNYYIAVCETCNQILVYSDMFGEKGPDSFTSTNLLWPKVDLHKSVPKSVSDCYKEAARIKQIAPNAFATQVRRALEAICDDREAKKGDLQERLSDLISKGELPTILGEMTDVLRIFGNRGAHAARKEVKPIHTLAIDDFFRAVVEYVYVAPSKLSEFRKSLQDFDSKIRTGKLVKTEDDMVHYVGKDSLIGIPDLATFNSWGFSLSQVLSANNAEKILPKQGILPTKKQGFIDPLAQMTAD